MANVQDAMNPDLMKFSISCFDVPEGLLDKNVSKNYFQQFGKLLRIRLRPKQKMCIVEYSNEESGVRALTESGDFDGIPFRVAWTKQKSVEKKKPRKKPLAADWPMDSDIQSELEAMRGSYSSNRSFAPRSEEQLSESPKKPPPVKKTPKIRQWKVEKPKTPKTPKTKPDIVTSLTQNTEQEQELLKLVMNSASTSEEKFRILDARDKLIRSRTVRQSELSRVAKTIGTCPDMCPEKERLMREVQHQVASYEQLSAHKGSMNHNLAVKQYSRSSADQESPLPHELRPVKVLLLTMGYLLHKIMDLCESEANLGEWYHFVWDRTRGIRKDVTQQELCCLDSVKLVEQCARFHVFCAARLVGEDVSVFDDKINTENLTKCLQTLKYMYHDLRVKHGVVCPNEAEFRAYIVLLNLNDGNFMWEVQQLDKIIQQSPEIRFALQVYSALDKNNYVRFFKLVKSTTYLNACILLRYFNQVRFKALLTILKSYSPRQPYMQYPIVELCRTLAFEDFQNTVEFIEYHGLGLNPEKTHVVLDRRMFQQPDIPFVLERAINVIESKRGCSVGEVVCGAPLPSKDFERHVPHNSFDDKGFLMLTELPKEFQGRYQDFLGKYSVSQPEIDENINEIEDEKLSDVEKIVVKVSENSVSEPDSSLVVFPGFKPPNFNDNRSQSPLTLNLAPKTDSFWSKPPQNQFNSSSNPVNIFGNDLQVPKPKLPEFKPISTGPTFNFIPSTNIIPPVIPIAPKPQPIITISTNFEPVWKPTIVDKKIDHVEQNKIEQLKIDREMKERMRKLKEKEEKEARIKMEKKLQEEKQKMLEKKQKEQYAAKLDAKIKSDVNSVLNNVLNRVEEHLVRTRLSEISENIKKRRALQFVKRWRNLTKMSRKKRKNFFDNPVWISSKSASSEAKELYSPSQSLTLHDIKRYKRGVPETIQITEQKSLESIDIFRLVYRILFEKLCTSDCLLNLNLFWKIGFSFRTGHQNNSMINRFYSLLKNLFDLQEINNENLIVKRCNANNGGSLTYCIKEISNFDNSTYLNGLIFVNFGSITQSTNNRLNKILNNSIPMSVVVIIKDSNLIDKKTIVQQLKLNYLIEKELITDYEVLFCSDNNLELTITSSLKFLANNVTAKPNLEMDALPAFLRNCIGEEFWYRIRSSCQINERLDILLREPNISIELHNESLRKSLDIILNSDIMNQPSFPNVFKPFVKQQQILLPCTYEYFPDYWNSKYYLNKVKKATESLFLPKFDYVWPPKDQCDLQDILEDYCGKVVKDPTCVVLKLLSLLLDKIDLNTNFQNQMKMVSWTDVIQVIILEKLSNTQFYDKTHAVFTVVYKSEDLKEFREAPWWYSTSVIKNKIKLVEIEEFSEPEIITDESEDEIDFEKTFSELTAVEDDNFEDQKKLKDDFKNLTSLLADLEESMEIQQKIMNKFQEKVTGTFNCK